MLIELNVGNYRSFKEKVTFSMVATGVTAKNKQIDENNVFEVGNNLRLLKTAAIYGANASGKSNFAKALDFMRHFVLNSSRESQATDPIPTEPFQLSTETEVQPSFFEIIFLLNGTRFRYGFQVTTERVISEWLYRTPKSREAKLFERDMGAITVGSSYKEGRGLEGRTRPNALFLSVAAQFNEEVAEQVLRWFRALDIQLGMNSSADYIDTVALLDMKRHQNEIIQLVKQLDLGIQDVRVERRRISVPPLLTLSNTSAEEVTHSDRITQAYNHFLQSFEGHEQLEAQTLHRVFNEQNQPVETRSFAFNRHESEGTKKLFGLAGSLVPALEQGLVVIVDELDARLHPLITCAIIDLFNNPKTNPHDAQLIFTTHDTNLLQNTIFRRDQIWFVEKDQFGSSHLYSLVEFKVRNDASFEKDYIQGRYGAIPFIGDLSQVLGHSDA